MTKATLTLPNGTVITVEGTVEDVKKLVGFYGDTPARSEIPRKKPKSLDQKHSPSNLSSKEYITKIVNLIKDCEESDAIEESIFDKVNMVNKILLPLYICHEYMENTIALQSGEISKITKELAIPISQPNVSTTLSGAASRYVMGDRTRKSGHVVKYKLNRRGLKYMKEIIKGKQKVEQ
jgi:hypothetical protein